jgi:hypothetical protein
MCTIEVAYTGIQVKQALNCRGLFVLFISQMSVWEHLLLYWTFPVFKCRGLLIQIDFKLHTYLHIWIESADYCRMWICLKFNSKCPVSTCIENFHFDLHWIFFYFILCGTPNVSVKNILYWLLFSVYLYVLIFNRLSLSMYMETRTHARARVPTHTHTQGEAKFMDKLSVLWFLD